MFNVWGRLAETGSGNKSALVAFDSARLEQRGGMLTFGKITMFVFYYTANFPPLTLAVFDVWGRFAETGSGNQSTLVAFESARVEQLGDMFIFCQGLRLLFYGTVFPIDIGRVRRVGLPRGNRKWK